VPWVVTPDPARNRVYLYCMESGTVGAFDADTPTALELAGSNPVVGPSGRSMALSQDSRLLVVSSFDAGTITVIDAEHMTYQHHDHDHSTITGCVGPRGMAFVEPAA
jgi:6-phosphogluconolactonase (cycloisomerase 2 family)